MTDKIIALTTCGSASDGEKLGRQLVERRLAACVNVLTGVRSVYRWKGAIEADDEVLLVIKTNQRSLDELRDTIKEIHAYDNPEFLVFSVDKGLREYLMWIDENVGPEAEESDSAAGS